MSRQIDHDNLTDDDKLYLAQRGLLSHDIMSVEEQRKLLDPEHGQLTLEQMANTGDVNLANVSKEDLEAELEKRRAAESNDHRSLMSKEGKAGAVAQDDGDSDEDEDEDAADYSSWSKNDLLNELGKRNDQRVQDGVEELPLTGNKAELVARLEADDEADEDESDEGDE